VKQSPGDCFVASRLAATLSDWIAASVVKQPPRNDAPIRVIWVWAGFDKWFETGPVLIEVGQETETDNVHLVDGAEIYAANCLIFVCKFKPVDLVTYNKI